LPSASPVRSRWGKRALIGKSNACNPEQHAVGRFSIWLDKKTIASLKEISKQMDRPVGWIIRKAVEDFIEKRKS
jgi:hypothetical protein